MVVQFFKSKQKLHTATLAGAGIFWMVAFLFGPLLYIITLSFWQAESAGGIRQEFTLENYHQVLVEGVQFSSFEVSNLYLLIFWQSLKFAIIVTVVTLVLGYIVGYYIGRTESNYKILLLVLMILPFWIPVIVRYYGWIHIIGNHGIITTALSWAGIHSEGWMYSRLAVISGLVQVFLPFMILPIYNSVNKINEEYIEGAKTLGASPARAFYEVALPLSLPGVIAGTIIVFILAIGTFLAPMILGGPAEIMIANLIARTFTKLGNWPLASAMSIVYISVLFAIISLYNRMFDLEEVLGGSE